MKSKNIVSSDADYQFNSTDASHTSEYLTEPILKLCRTLGASKIVDLGCGNGALCKQLHNAGFQVTGFAPSETGIEYARKAVPNANFKVMGVYDNPKALEEVEFDAVISTEVVEHLFYPRYLPRFAHQLLKPNGYLIVSTPYHGYLKNLFLSLFDKWDFHHTPLWDGGHVKFWSKATLSQLLEEEGFEVMTFIGAGRIPFLWKSMIIVARRTN